MTKTILLLANKNKNELLVSGEFDGDHEFDTLPVCMVEIIVYKHNTVQQCY